MHRSIARKLGAKRGSVPFLQTDGGVIAGSSAIIDWCEEHHSGKRASLAGEAPDQVRRIFSDGLPLWQRAAVTLGGRASCRS
jgi:glutathione S-transferase